MRGVMGGTPLFNGRGVGGREARKLSVVCLDGPERMTKAGFVERLRKLLEEAPARGRARGLHLAGQHWNFSPIPRPLRERPNVVG